MFQKNQFVIRKKLKKNSEKTLTFVVFFERVEKNCGCQKTLYKLTKKQPTWCKNRYITGCFA